ncbi:MAG: putative histidine kinase, atypical hybrid [Verrucomicrobiales bacterium]|nr:putative histidine kinase, atypical hybrid [Verrucomicrobiales bacterium]
MNPVTPDESMEPPWLPAIAEDPINILLVDDEPRNLLALETVLDDPGYRLMRANSADEALLALVAEEFALLVLDVQMPGMNGFELALMIKQRRKTASVPIIFLTAYHSGDEHVIQGYSTGAVDFLEKPINAVVLRSKVAVFAELHRKTRESVLANQALLAEVAERRRTQEQLRTLNEELELRVAGRTAELTQSEEALRLADRRKDEFLAMLGHELRNPLAAIRHAVSFRHECPEDEAGRLWADEVIDRQSAQLARMVDDLLDVERINRGRIELRPSLLNLDHVLSRAVEAVHPLMEQKHHRLSYQKPAAPLAVRGDAARLEQVFVNLLNNAAKYTPGEGRILLVAEREQDEAVISITDNGVGIDPSLMPHVFDLFTQAHTSLDRSEGGLGIGLTVVRSLIEMHSGKVAIAANGGTTGTTFTVRLPLVDETPPAPSGKTPPDPEPDAMRELIRVLIVDDHIDGAQTLARLLTRRNCDVRLAHDGQAGVAAAREFLPEVLLLDLGLPGIDGFEVARTLRADPAFADALFVAISGYAQESDRQKTAAAGFSQHCAKPVDFSALMGFIHQWSADHPVSGNLS